MSYRGDFKAFVLAWVEAHGATSAEAAAHFGVKSGTIRMWKRRALQKPPKPPHKDRPTLYPPCAIGAEALALHATGLTWVEVSSRMGLDYTSVYYRAVVKPRRPRTARPPKKTREEKNARDRAYRARNRDIILERDRRRHAANRESERERHRQRYLANRDAILAADTARKAKDPEKYRARRAEHYQRTAESQKRYSRAYRIANPEACRSREKAYAAAHKEERNEAQRMRWAKTPEKAREKARAKRREEKSRRLYGPEWGSVHRALCDLRAAIKERTDK